ncbi:formimidoylglutamate deiminase [Sandaracinus amylolyticus]|uniref:formimidoylglutamate deiminase n=1 Tax=Sandaracinus amylolyticus TaxID=927083 RepID=UPI001F015647|nr:formimidoylglutamate deiminase [Sandaracinus amylolyticus]UJR79287.1 N-formimino-L-glutamate deiminase [Sandaracinus amylolyticus]
MTPVRLEGDHLVLPGLASAHSHAFQRALRARTQRRAATTGSFWSWRGLMYELAARVTPDDVFDLSRFAFVELARAGVTAVGEFHYLHHDTSGAPYADRLALSHAVIRAAREAGVRITLLRVVYQRAGTNRPPEGAQHRFCDPRLDDALADVDALAAHYANDPLVRIGIAPHSVRAVPRETLRECASFARARSMPVHAHVAEQRREIRECLAEHGRRPVELLADEGVLDARFVAVHATHLRPHDARLLGDARAFACVCRTTERDLGDGLADVAAMRAAGVRLCTGADSHAISDPFEEARAVELDDRTRAEARHVAADADDLLAALAGEGYASIGWDDAEREDEVRLDASDPALVGTGTSSDAVIWGASPRCVREVRVAGRTIVADGQHVAEAEARAGYVRALARLGLS